MHKMVGRLSAKGVLLALVLGAFSVAQAETWELKFMPTIPKPGERDGKPYPSPDVFRGASQTFNLRFITGSEQKPVDPAKDPCLRKFYEIVTKEPAYTSEHPLKGVIRFGEQRLAFAMDAVPEEKKPADEKSTDDKSADDRGDKKLSTAQKVEAKRKQQMATMAKLIFNRLYFDLNANGDLTDDKPIEQISSGHPSTTYARASFNVTIPCEQDGEKFEVPSNFAAYVRSWSQQIRTASGEEKTLTQTYMGVAFSTTCFREGEVRLDGKTYRAFLVDYNNNGLFNDKSECSEFRDTNRVSPGDTLYLFPADMKQPLRFAWPIWPCGRDQIAALSVDSTIGSFAGKYWNIEVTPSGNKLTLTPYTEPLGFVEMPGLPFSLSAFNKDAKSKMSIVSDENGKATLPPGEWVLSGYALTFQEKKSEGDESEKPDTPPSPKAVDASVLARLPGTGNWLIKVAANETTALKFGSPYTVALDSSVRQPVKGTYEVRLSLKMTGTADEPCSSITLGTGRPPEPTFVIMTKDGKEVESGAFEYG